MIWLQRHTNKKWLQRHTQTIEDDGSVSTQSCYMRAYKRQPVFTQCHYGVVVGALAKLTAALARAAFVRKVQG